MGNRLIGNRFCPSGVFAESLKPKACLFQWAQGDKSGARKSNTDFCGLRGRARKPTGYPKSRKQSKGFLTVSVRARIAIPLQ